jgi:hypothetical protein
MCFFAAAEFVFREPSGGLWAKASAVAKVDKKCRNLAATMSSGTTVAGAAADDRRLTDFIGDECLGFCGCRLLRETRRLIKLLHCLLCSS